MTRARTQSRNVESETRQAGSRDRLKIIVGAIALGALILFLAQNLQEVDVHFLWFDWSTRMVWAILASAVVGALAVVGFSTFRSRRNAQR